MTNITGSEIITEVAKKSQRFMTNKMKKETDRILRISTKVFRLSGQKLAFKNFKSHCE